MTNQLDDNYDDMPSLTSDISPLTNNSHFTVRNAIRDASYSFVYQMPNVSSNNLPSLRQNPYINLNNTYNTSQIISPLPNDYQINFDVLYSENIGFEIKPYLIYTGNNNNNQSLIRLNDNNWELFVMVARIREKVVFIKINATNQNLEYKTIICPETLINNYATYGDQYIMINYRPVYCGPDSELYRGCEWAIRHTQPFHYSE